MFIHQFRRLLRQWRLLILFVFVTLMFLVYQLLSVGQLGKELSKRKSYPKFQSNLRSYEKADGVMQVKLVEEDKSKEHENTNYIRGVLPENQKFYYRTSINIYKCIDSTEEIPSSWVNDNFCDCKDFSDEPSTSACNFGRFYCSHQAKHNPTFIVSYKVNDGICDCCDGSDEWENVRLPEHTLVPANKQKGAFQIPCPVHCVV